MANVREKWWRDALLAAFYSSCWLLPPSLSGSLGFRSHHCQADWDLRSAPAGGCLPQPGGAGSCSHLRGRVHDRVPSPGHPPGRRSAEDRGLPGHLHRRGDFQWLPGGLWQASRLERRSCSLGRKGQRCSSKTSPVIYVHLVELEKL